MSKRFKLSKDKSWELCVICSKPVSDDHIHREDMYFVKKDGIVTLGGKPTTTNELNKLLETTEDV